MIANICLKCGKYISRINSIDGTDYYICSCGYVKRVSYSDEKDTINPSHYKSGDIECIKAIEAALTPEEFRGYIKGNVIKYTWRERKKGGDDDLKKAKRYLEILEEVE